MLKKILLLALMLALCIPCTAYSAEIPTGFSESLSYTDSENEYHFNPDGAIAVINKEVNDDPDYDFLPPGTDLYLPIYVCPLNSSTSIPATDKMIKNDNVTVSSKVLTGKNFIGTIEIVDGKKLKLKSVPAGAYVKIPITMDYLKEERTAIRANFVISVNNYTYDLTESTLKCFVQNPVTYVDRNSVFGAKVPSMFKTDKFFSGEATFDFGNGIKYTSRVKRYATYYLNLSREPIPDIKAMYSDAWLDFYNFLGNNDTFESTGTLEIPINRSNLSKKGQTPELYAYKVNGNTLTALGTGIVSFDPKNNRLFIKTKTLECYVLSNRALMREISPNSEDNILRSGYAESK